MKFIRTDSDNEDFQILFPLLDKELKFRDGDDHAFYAQFNKVDKIHHVIIASTEDQAVGCGALKMYDSDTVEIKRMYVLESFRGRGIALRILEELESWASELNFNKAILETGKAQPEAIALYRKCSYEIIPNYGQYVGVENSVCMQKSLSKKNLETNFL